MKKRKLFLGLGAVAISLLLVTCDLLTTNPAPTFSIDNDDPTLLAIGVSSLTITGTITADAGLAEVTVVQVTGADEQELGSYSDFTTGPFTTVDDVTYDISLSITNITEEVTIRIDAMDNDDQSSSESIVIQPAGIAEHTVVLMGAQNNADYGSTASLVTGEVYKITGGEAATNCADVDIVYYYGSKLAALYSPTQSDIQNVVLFNIPSWTTINDTKLGVSTMSVAEFDAAASLSDIESVGTPTLDVVPELALNDIIVFETDGGKIGVFKVSDLDEGAAGTITLTVKVEI